MTSQPLVSVVTPFYNTDDYLAGAIESVLAQTYQNFEYLLVNNCSTDRSAEIAQEYARKDPRIRFFTNEKFVGQIENYNGALTRISPDSKYFKMIQADDAAFPRCLEEMVAAGEAHPNVGVVSAFRMVEDKVSPPSMPLDKSVMSGRDVGRLCFIEDPSLFGSQTTVMIRADIVRGRRPFYPEGRLFPDTDVLYEILRDTDFAFVHQILTFTRLERGSTWGRMASYRPMLLDRRIRLKCYGRDYLAPDEYARCLDEHEREFHAFLGKAWLVRREEGFWEYYRKGLATIGEEIDRARLPKDAAAFLLQFATEGPQAFGSRLARRVRDLVGGGAPT